MSQPENFGPNHVDPLDVPITSFEDLEKLFYDAERPANECLLGIEYEIFGQIDKGQKPIPFLGPVSIQALFENIIKKGAQSGDAWVPYLEENAIVALTGKRAVIALEPGGQIEIAARPHHHLSESLGQLNVVVKDIAQAAQELGIDLFALGIHPFASRQDMAQVKKARYGIMRSYMGGLSGLGLDMMTRSCAIQFNLDFVNEQDTKEKMRLAACLVPWYALLSSSVAYVDKIPAKIPLMRGDVWRQTDPKRTGIPPIIFADHFGYRAWIDFVLDVPMYFIRRGHTYHSVPGASFRAFIKDGLLGFHATLRDFIDQLSCVFTEVRLKPILEIRTPDSLPLPILDALSALTYALFYDKNARTKAQEIFADITHQELVAVRNDVIDNGIKATFHNQSIFIIAEQLLGYAQDALNHRAIQEKNPRLASMLTPLNRLVTNRTTYATWIKHHFKNLSETNLPDLIKAFDPLTDPMAS